MCVQNQADCTFFSSLLSWWSIGLYRDLSGSIYQDRFAGPSINFINPTSTCVCRDVTVILYVNKETDNNGWREDGYWYDNSFIHNTGYFHRFTSGWKLVFDPQVIIHLCRKFFLLVSRVLGYRSELLVCGGRLFSLLGRKSFPKHDIPKHFI